MRPAAIRTDEQRAARAAIERRRRSMLRPSYRACWCGSPIPAPSPNVYQCGRHASRPYMISPYMQSGRDWPTLPDVAEHLFDGPCINDVVERIRHCVRIVDDTSGDRRASLYYMGDCP